MRRHVSACAGTFVPMIAARDNPVTANNTAKHRLRFERIQTQPADLTDAMDDPKVTERGFNTSGKV